MVDVRQQIREYPPTLKLWRAGRKQITEYRVQMADGR